MCTVDSGTGALTLAGVGSCVVTVTAESSANYNQATATFTVTVQDTLALSVAAIATDNTVNIAEKTAGFAISGTTGSEGGVSVTVTVGSMELSATSAETDPATWSVTVLANAAYITGTSVNVSVSASKTGFAAPSPVTRTLAVDLAAPSVSYTAPASLKVGVAITAMTPTTADTDIASYSATGLPSGLTIHSGTGAISGTPDTAAANAVSVTVTVTDTAGNPTDVSITFPTVDKGDQTLTGFAYSPDTVTFGDTAPTVTAPSGAQTTLEYSATPSTVCTVDSGTGALTLAGVGECVITVTAESSDNYNRATATFTVTVQDTLALTVDAKVTLTVSPTSVAEDATGTERTVTVTVTLDGESRSEDTEVTVSVAAGTAVEGADFSAVTNVTVTIAGGATSGTATFDLVPLDDNIDEPDETVIVSGTTTASDLTVEPADGVTLTIEDDEAPPVISLILTPESISENRGASTVTAQLSHPSSEAVRVGAYMLYPHLYDGIVVDWSSNRHLTFAAEQMASTGVVTIMAIDNEVDNPDRVVPIKGSLSAEVLRRGITFPEAANLTVVDDDEAPLGTLALSVDAIATDGTVNIAEKTAGFAISGATGSEAGVAVSVTIGSQSPLTATSDGNGAWSVSVPANATYITGTSVAVSVSASKTGYTSPDAVTRTLAVDLAAPSVSYTAPASLKVGVAITAMTPTTADTDIASYSATGLPSGLTIHSGTGAISGTPDTAAANAVSVTVTVTDTAGNPTTVSLAFPAVDKGDQTLTGFAYSPDTVTFGDTAPTVTAPTGAQTTLAYTATSSTVCTVDSGTGALTLAGVGECVISVIAESSDNYNRATATFTVTVQDTLALTVDAKVTLTVSPTSVAEDATGTDRTVTVTVTLDGESRSEDTEVTVSVAAGTAVEGADFSAVANVTVTIAGGATSGTATFDLVPLDDNIDEPDETVIVSGTTTASDLTVEPADGVTLTIEDDEAPPVISLILTPESISENRGASTVTAQLSHPSSEAVRVGAYMLYPHLYDGIVVDWSSNRHLTFAAEQMASTGVVTIMAIDNEVDNPDRVVPIKGSLSAEVLRRGITFPEAANLTVVDDDEAPLGTLALSVDAIATDGTVNIAEKTAGFAISGATGSEAGVAVSVTIGSQSPLTATSDGNGAWSVSVPANATYITGTSVAVSVSASKTGYTSPDAVTRTLAVDLAAPSVSYTAPASLKVGVAISAVTPSTADTDIASYSATGLPSGLTIHSSTGAISGTPDTAAANAVSVTVTVTDTAGNPTTVSLAFPAVDKGDQTLTGFAYSPDTVTFGDTAPTVTAPTGAQTTLAYTATSSTVCTVDSGTGALTLAGVGECVITVIAESSDNYNRATATFTVTVQDTVALSVDAIATDGTVNIAEKAAGFAISGTTGSEAGVSVTVTVGSMELSATSAETDPATWSVTVPANAAYITGTSVNVSVSASKTGFAAPSPVTRTLAVDLAAPSVSYTAPASLKVGVAITAMTPTTADTDIASYSATGLPSGLTIHSGTGAISGTPDTAAANAVSVTVTVTDTAGNPTTVSLAFPAVDKGDQTLTGFAYSTDTVTFGDTAPSVTAPSGAHTTLAYTATPSSVCSVDSGTGALTLAGVGSCVVTVTAESSANYNQATATFTVTVQDTLALSVDAIATDDTVNIAEKTAGFAISGTTGSEGGVSVTVTVGSMTLTATSAETDPATWSVSVPANAAYIAGTSVAVSVSASKTGYTSPDAVTRTLTVDLAAPSVSYTAPASLKVGVAISAVTPSTADTDIASYSATGLPSGLTIHSGTGHISGTPDVAAANAATATVTVTDSAGNPTTVSLAFPAVDKGDQTLTGFAYSPDTVTFGNTAPTVTAPSGAQTTLEYSATPSTVCTVDSGTGALTLAGVGECVITVTAESSANYNQATATFTVTVQDTLALSVDAIATDNTVNIAEKTAGFAISGATGSEGGVSVTVTVGSMELSATSAETDPATWSVSVPANAAYITGTSVNVSVSASKTGFAAPSPVTRTLAVDLAAPSVSYTAPASLKVGVAITAMTPTTADTDIASYSATGLPSGLTIHSGTGAISGTPDTAAANAVSVTVTVTDTAGNPTTVSLAFPAVDKGDQTLTGFAYSTDTVTFGDTAPSVTAPSGAHTTLAYTATPSSVCSVDSATGALTLAGVGECVITVTAESSDNYNRATATFTVTVQDTLALSVDAIATDNTVNIAEKTAGFAISGATGSEAGVAVSVTIGSQSPLTASSDNNGAWSVRLPANAAYITGTSVAVSASASKTGFTAPSPVTRTLAVDLAAPSVSYTAPASLKVGVAITAMTPTTADTDIASYSATGLPSGLTIHSGTGAISGTPDTAAANAVSVTVTVTDTAGNPTTVSLAFPAVDKGDQTLTGFAYSTDTVTFGDTAPSVTAPSGAHTTLAYTATPSSACSVDSGTGALTLAGVGSCVVTVTAESSANYNQATATFTVTVQDTLALSVDAIATDDTVNIAEKTAGFAISGTTGSEAGVAVSVAIGSQSPLTATSDNNGAWSVSVPANAAYITGTSVAVSVSASKTGYTSPDAVTRTLAVDLAAPSVSYTAPASLKVGVAITAMTPTTADTDIASYNATGLPSGLTIHSGTGAISGTPDTAAANAATATVTVTDTAGNPTTVSLAFPAVDKGDQTLTGFAYSTDTVTFGDTAPSVTAPSGAQTTLAYTATPSTVCTVDSGTGALTLAGVGECVITVTAESSANYNQATATFTVTVQDTLALSVDAIATDNTVNIAEKTAGFAISGATGSEAGVAVSVTIGSQSPLTATSDNNGAWSVRLPANAAYITGTSVAVSASASKTGFTAPSPVTRTLAVDLAAPSVSYTAPASLKVGVAISAVTPSTADTDIASYSATGLPSGLTIHSGTGAISGTPDMAAANAVTVTVTVTDTAGNPTTVSLAFPAVDKGDQTLTGFAYSPDTVTFGNTAPTVTVPSGAQTTLEYSATPSTVCTVDSGTGALTLAGVGECVITVTAESSANYNQATATFTVTVQDTLALSVDAIATDNTVNIAEKTAGFAISGATGSEGGVSVTVTVGSMTLTATSAETDPATWSVSVPANAAYIAGTSVAVSVSASKTGYTSPDAVTRTLTVDLAAPSVSYTAPASLKVGVAISAVTPSTADTDIASYSATGLPSGLTIHSGTGHISGTPDTAAANAATATVTVTDSAGNPTTVSLAFPAVDKGDQTLTGFAYSPDTVTFGNTAPTVTAPSGAQTTLEYSATPSTVCTVDSGTGALTLAGVGECVITVTAELSANYNQATATFTVTVQDTLALSVDAIATDNTVNIAEKTAGFAISGTTGSEGGVSVTVTVGSMELSATSAETDPATWSVSVPANAAYITGTSVNVSVSASKTGFAAPSPVTRTLAVDLAAPSVSYTAPASLKVGVAITAMTPTTADTDIASYSATGLPSGLTIHSGTGAISGTPDTAAANAVSVTVTVTDTAGNPTTVSLAFPAVDKGDQTLTGFAYSTDTVTFGDTAPSVTAPSGAHTTLAYTATPSSVCSVDSGTGALTLAGVGSCVVTVTAESSANYDQATATFTVTVQDTLALSVDAIATDDTVNIAEKTAGFAISGTTGSEGGVSVTVTVGSMTLTATSAETDPATWSVSVPANAAYIAGTSVAVSVSASKTGYTSPDAVTRTLTVDLAAPSVSYTAPASLKVGVAISAVTPSTADTDIASYSATGLPSGLTIHSGTGHINGTPDTAAANAVSVTVTVTDTAGNPTTVSIAFPAVDKGDQTLTGFAYSPDTVTFGDTAPTVTAPTGAQTTLAYTATPSTVCTVDSGTGALTLAGVGSCVVTVTAESSANYDQATATFTVTVQDTLALSVDAIATDDTVNIAEKTAGFAISGTTGSEGGVSVTVTVGSMTLTATSAETDPATWSVSVPANAAYIAGTSVAVSVSASKTGYTSPDAVTRTLTVDLAAPSVSYTAPASLKVGMAISAVTPSTADTDIASYSATGLPSGLTIHSGTGHINGTPDTAAANAVSVTVTVTDSAGNPTTVSLAFPAVDKGDQTLTGFAYSPDTVTFGNTAPTVTAPSGAQTTLAYTATPSTVCTVDSGTGALTLAGVGECVITVTAESSDNYNRATATFTVTVQDTLALSVDAIATDNTVNIAEKAAGFAISGTTGSEAGVAVSVTIGSQSPLTASSDNNGAWSVRLPANAAYITGTSVAVSASASKTGFTAPSPVTRTLAVDLAAPSVSYTAPASLKVGVAITAMTPTTADTDIASYSATGLPSGLTIHSGTGAISGTPDTAAANAVSVTVTVTDTAGNPTTVSLAFPAVDKGDQTLTGFAYSTDTVTFGDTAPSVTAPSGAHTTLAYTATPSSACSVDSGTGALTLAGVGECVITVTAASNANYNQATATFTVTVQEPLLTTPGKPRAPQISSGNGSVIVQWLAPSFDGGTPILRYEYCLLPMYQCNNQWVEIPDSAPDRANHGRYAITRPNGAYTSLYLRAVNAQGAGPFVNLQAIARAGAPGAPTNLRSEAISAEHVKISWTEPAAPAGTTIRGYILERSHDGVTWAHDDGCRHTCSQQHLGARWEPRGTTSVTVQMGPLYTLLYYRIRTIFETNTPTVVSGIDLSQGFSETSPIIEVTTAGGTGSLALPELGVSDGFGREGPNAAIVFNVTLTGPQRRPSPVTVSYRTQDMTARAGSDYTSRSGTLVFQPDETEKTVSVPIIDDTVEDSGEEFVLRLSNVSGAHLARAGAFGTIYNSEDILSGFTLVNAASGTDVGGLDDGATVTLDDPTHGQYGMRAGTVPGTGVNSVRLELSGAKTVTRTDNEAPFTLHAEGGEGLPPGAYTLQATAYSEAGRGGNALQTISVSFTVAASTQDEEEGTALSATFPASPYASRLHAGASDRPRVVVAFSEAVTAIAANTPSAVVTGGTIASVRAYTEDGLSNAWIFFVTPDGDGDVTFTLVAGAACDNGGICTASGTTLTQVPAARTLPGPGDDDEGTDDSGNPSLTASFSAMPGEHGGPGERFSFELAFSEAPEVSYRMVRDDAFTITGGAVRIARRLEKPSNIRWQITVEPSGWGDVAISLPGGRACTSSGGICTSDNRMLANSPSAIVQGPAALSVADANAREGTDATLDFAVTLDRASPLTVTVHYATEDGTAAAGADYTATSGTLSFAPGDLAKTVSVPILDDVHDEGSETLTLTLSNATGARIRDAWATGTIKNSDPIPKAWLARFGRTVADHVVDAVGERLEGSPGGGSQVTLGGQRIQLDGAGNGTFPGSTAGNDTREDGTEADTLAAFAARISDDGAGTGWVNRGDGGREDAATRRASRTLTERELLLGSSFVLALGGDGASGTGTAWTAWGRAAASGFDGVADGLPVDGEVTTFTLGADAARGRWLGGVALAHSTGEGGFRDHADSDHDGGGTGTLKSTLASVHPYLRYRATERLSLWGGLGYGTGDLTLAVDAAGTKPRRTWKTETGMWMAAAGARGVLLAAPDTGGLELAARGDFRLVGMRSEASTGADGAGPLTATESETSRLRFMLEGSRGIALVGGRTLTPTLEVALRHDGGDAETGTGIDVGASVSYADPELGLTVEGTARGLLAHEDTDYREWGASGSVRIDPGAAGRGLALSLSPAWGADLGGAERLWSARDARGLAATDTFEPAGRLEAEAGYGLGAFGGHGVMTPFVGLSLSEAGNRTRRGGVRWTLGPTVAFGVEGALCEAANDNAAEHEIGFKLTARF